MCIHWRWIDIHRHTHSIDMHTRQGDEQPALEVVLDSNATPLTSYLANYTHIYTYIYIYIYAFVYIYICAYVYIYYIYSDRIDYTTEWADYLGLDATPRLHTWLVIL